MNDLNSDTQIELHVPDFELTKNFYGQLGFKVVWERSGDNIGYLVMRRGPSLLNFYGGNTGISKHQYFKRFPEDTPKGYGIEIILPVEGIEDFFDQFKSNFEDKIVENLNHKHSHKDFRATDPFGFYLRFVEKYNWVEGRDKSGNPE